MEGVGDIEGHGGAYFRNFTVFSPKLGVKIKCDFLGALVLVMYKYKYKKTFVYSNIDNDKKQKKPNQIESNMK